MDKKDILKTIDKMFPPEEFENLTSQTREEPNALSKEFVNHANAFFNQIPEVGIIYFERLSNGKYMVRHYVSRE